ncbi:uncharacterized protein LOC128389823 [Panonychus citri]|uniref:uncharacterized protein LOC128389823 n=1 Tax=Panonychus citri TaxID=50023 RepID=UPI002307CC53|nr:uncharacterized protein LOC128389823 [Panonychus citri]XP_053205431.1 uncharacterized protein LOC128389823 [Panonychus citri]
MNSNDTEKMACGVNDIKLEDKLKPEENKVDVIREPNDVQMYIFYGHFCRAPDKSEQRHDLVGLINRNRTSGVPEWTDCEVWSTYRMIIRVSGSFVCLDQSDFNDYSQRAKAEILKYLKNEYQYPTNATQM